MATVIVTVPAIMERLDSGNRHYKLSLCLYDTDGSMESPDSAPTIAAANNAGANRSDNLESTTMTALSTGVYEAFYILDAADSLEQLIFTFTVTENALTSIFKGTSVVIHKNYPITEIAEQIWENAVRTLTQSSGQVARAVRGTSISVHRGDTVTINLVGIGSLAGRTKLWFTVKKKDSDTDANAIIQVVETTGMTVLNRAAAASAGLGSVVVTDQAAGDLTITLDEDATKVLAVAADLVYDIQIKTASGIFTRSAGLFAVTADVTRAVA